MVPLYLVVTPVMQANALVEEFMLLANITVGKKILRYYCIAHHLPQTYWRVSSEITSDCQYPSGMRL